MEEKERYKFGQRTLFYSGEELTTFDGFNLDDFMQIICKLLNQQDREINILTKMLYTTTKHADKLNEENNKLNKIIKANIISADKVVKENKKLKQSQKQLAISELEKIKRYIDDNAYYIDELNFGEEINEYIDNQINELGGEKNE